MSFFSYSATINAVIFVFRKYVQSCGAWEWSSLGRVMLHDSTVKHSEYAFMPVKHEPLKHIKTYTFNQRFLWIDGYVHPFRTRCPICRESFAHHLEKRSILNPGKTGAKEWGPFPVSE